MFNNSRDMLINGGTFHNVQQHHHQHHHHQHGPSHNIQNVTKSAKDRLLEASALGAMHNSGERFNPPKCHPNTRIAVLEKIIDWFVGRVGWDVFVLWLYGPAGAGKSAIAQTFAERCALTNGLLASFFFSRSDPKRNNEKALVATLAYQISLRISGFWEILERIINKDPAAFQLNFDTQFQTLILGPLLELSTTGLFTAGIQLPYIIVIDGLDECTGLDVQKNILSTISNALEQHRLTLPFMFLIASRPEHHLTVVFNNPSLNSLTLRLALDDTYQPDTDIRLYLIDSFRQIRHTHIMQAHIPESWPNEDDITKLVEKSSGQFIYGATVIRYVSSPRHNPMNRLKVVQGLLPVNNDKPYAELDALYTNILLGVEDTDATLRVLGVNLVQIFTMAMNIDELEQFMLLEPGSIQLLLIDLASVVDASDNKRAIKFLHASFGDFLFDQTRSFQFHISPDCAHEEAANLCLMHIHSSLSLSSDAITIDHDILYYALWYLDDHLKALSSLRENFSLREATLNMLYVQSVQVYAKCYPEDFDEKNTIIMRVEDLLDFLKTSSFLNTEELYLHHRDVVDQFYLKNLSSWSPTSRELAYWTSCGVIQGFFDINTYIDYDTIMALPSAEEMDEGILHLLLYLIQGGPRRTVAVNDKERYTLSGSHYLNLKGGIPSLLQGFLIDPARAGPYAVTDLTYTMAAEFIIAFAVRSWDARKNVIHDRDWDSLWDSITSILPKAEYSDELVNVLNHQNITFVLGKPYSWGHLESVYREVTGYLLRCTGFTPPGFQIIIDWTRRKKTRAQKESANKESRNDLGKDYDEDESDCTDDESSEADSDEENLDDIRTDIPFYLNQRTVTGQL